MGKRPKRRESGEGDGALPAKNWALPSNAAHVEAPPSMQEEPAVWTLNLQTLRGILLSASTAEMGRGCRRSGRSGDGCGWTAAPDVNNGL